MNIDIIVGVFILGLSVGLLCMHRAHRLSEEHYERMKAKLRHPSNGINPNSVRVMPAIDIPLPPRGAHWRV